MTQFWPWRKDPARPNGALVASWPDRFLTMKRSRELWYGLGMCVVVAVAATCAWAIWPRGRDELGISLQLLGAMITLIGLGRAFWGIRDVLNRPSVAANIFAPPANFGTEGNLSPIVVAAIDGTKPIEEQVAQMRERLVDTERQAKQSAVRLKRAEATIEQTGKALEDADTRLAQQSEHRMQQAVKNMKTESKLDLLRDIAYAFWGLVVSIAGTAVGFCT